MSRPIRLLLILAAALPVLLTARAAPHGDPFTDPWLTECIDCVPRIDELSNRTAALAPDGTLHAVYSAEDVNYLTYRGGTPVVTTLEARGPTGAYFNAPIIDIDARGRVHALYLRSVYAAASQTTVHTLRYARQTAQGWRFESLPYTPADPFRYAMVVAPDGRLHVSAHTTAGYVYATRDANGWSAAQPFDNIIFETTLTMDPAGRPAACYPNGGQSLALARHDGATWQTETIPAGTRPASGCVVAFAADGRAHLVYRAEEGLLYLWRSATGWVSEVIAPPTAEWQPGYGLALRLDPDGRPHVAYHAQSRRSPPEQYAFARAQYYATRTLTGWKVESVDAQISARQGTMLLAGSAPYVVYRDRLGLALAERRDGVWSSLRLVRSGDVGYDVVLAGRGRALHAVYFDMQNEAYFYAAGGPGDWQVTLIDQRVRDTRRYYFHNDLALAPDGTPHVVYEFYDPLISFNYAIGTGTGWQRAALPGDNCGPYRLVISRTGRAAMSQNRCAQTGLEFIPWPPPAAPYELVDAAARGAQAMAIDAQGRVHLAYKAEGTSPRIPIRYARRDLNGRWTIQTITDGPFTGGGALGVGLALDAAGQPFVVINAFGAITVATPGAAGGAWQLDRRLGASSADDGSPNIVVDARGRLHVLYNGPEDGALVYARRDAAGWRKRDIAPASAYHSLTTDPFGNPVVAYRDEATGDARLTYVPADIRGQAYAPLIRR
jgi:hypothetical protein